MKRLEGVIQSYAWGSTDFIAKLLGTRPTGEPQAELWLGAHASAPALVDGQPLDELVLADPEATIGTAAADEFGPMLPYLLKVLSAAKPLSLQAHPSRAEAEAGFAAEEKNGVAIDDPTRTYRDSWPKPEMLCALVDTEILCGFRTPSETYELFAGLGVPAALELVEPLRDGGAEELEQVFSAILRLDERERQVIGQVAQAAGRVGPDGDLGLFAETARRLAEPYPEDPGVFAALLMNRVNLRPNEATYLDAGNLHAYLLGSAVEIMANSDNVLRGGLTSKHVNVPELLKVLDFTPGPAPLVVCQQESAGVWGYPVPAPEFALWRLEPNGTQVPVPKPGTGRVLVVTSGAVTVRSGSASERLTLDRGGSAFVFPGDEALVEGTGVVFVAAPGVG